MTARTNRGGVLAVLICCVLATGCGPTLIAVSTPPPMRIARLDSDQPLFGKRKHWATLSAGVALAFNCQRNGPCRDATATSDDPSVARVVPAHLNRLGHDQFARSDTPVSTFVVMGVSPGKTTIRVRSDNGDTKLTVTVTD